MKIKSQRDFFSGLLFIVAGAAFAWGASTYPIGRAARMGPGYFPFVLGVVLIAVLWLKDNIPEKLDIEWLKQGGGFIPSEAPSGPPVQRRREGGVSGRMRETTIGTVGGLR